MLYDNLKAQLAAYLERVLDELFIERMEFNEELFSDYMSKPEMQELVSKWLGNQVYERLNGLNTRSNGL